MSASSGQSQFAAPPRTIGTPLAARVLLGSQTSQIGWTVLVFGSFMFWIFAWHADISAWRFKAGRVARAGGEALGCKATGFSEGGTKSRRGTPIYENHYCYRVAGRLFEGSSFAKGRCAGGAVDVEYLTVTPEVSRIAGMRRRPFSRWVALTAVAPAVGLFMVLAAFAEGRTRLRLLRGGLPATGRLIQQTRTNVRANGRQVYRLTFEYCAQSGVAGQVTTRTNRPARFKDKAGAALLYDPADLKRAVLLASFPGTVAAGEAGQPVARGSAAFLLLPAATILGNAWYACRHWVVWP